MQRVSLITAPIALALLLIAVGANGAENCWTKRSDTTSYPFGCYVCKCSTGTCLNPGGRRDVDHRPDEFGRKCSDSSIQAFIKDGCENINYFAISSPAFGCFEYCVLSDLMPQNYCNDPDFKEIWGTETPPCCAKTWECPAGYYEPATAPETCRACAKGSYQDISGSGSCIECPAGTFIDVEGATSSDMCKPVEQCPNFGAAGKDMRVKSDRTGCFEFRDECADGSSGCPVDRATCVDKEDGFDCNCKPGFYQNVKASTNPASWCPAYIALALAPCDDILSTSSLNASCPSVCYSQIESTFELIDQTDLLGDNFQKVLMSAAVSSNQKFKDNFGSAWDFDTFRQYIMYTCKYDIKSGARVAEEDAPTAGCMDKNSKDNCEKDCDIYDEEATFEMPGPNFYSCLYHDLDGCECEARCGSNEDWEKSVWHCDLKAEDGATCNYKNAACALSPMGQWRKEYKIWEDDMKKWKEEYNKREGKVKHCLSP